MQANVMQKLISIQRWFDSVALLKELSRLSDFDPKEVQSAIGWEKEVGYFLDVFIPSRKILSIQFKANAPRKYWVYLSIGSVGVKTIDGDLLSINMLRFLIQSVHSISDAAKYGTCSLEINNIGGIDVVYAIPLSICSLVSPASFTKLITSIIHEVQSDIREVQTRNLDDFNNNNALADEFAEYEEYEDDNGVEPQV